MISREKIITDKKPFFKNISDWSKNFYLLVNKTGLISYNHSVISEEALKDSLYKSVEMGKKISDKVVSNRL